PKLAPRDAAPAGRSAAGDRLSPFALRATAARAGRSGPPAPAPLPAASTTETTGRGAAASAASTCARLGSKVTRGRTKAAAGPMSFPAARRLSVDPMARREEARDGSAGLPALHRGGFAVQHHPTTEVSRGSVTGPGP